MILHSSSKILSVSLKGKIYPLYNPWTTLDASFNPSVSISFDIFYFGYLKKYLIYFFSLFSVHMTLWEILSIIHKYFLNFDKS